MKTFNIKGGERRNKEGSDEGGGGEDGLLGKAFLLHVGKRKKNICKGEKNLRNLKRRESRINICNVFQNVMDIMVNAKSM